ncbi:hypothetical protein D8M04_19340 [Oceanobacillus piezotolerans]|uniref:LppX_LprAFG lipoprotein n=1 Tax=Oceanobacillus piezotolerans TaxID=2448030 RepID=A0A498D3A8_9BACI|nr:DUF6612 family protein [Oceanobacillus piezotolerans]RLL40393.1 hypothetical protein D8M04_19340 [Oceanobacillus piezotolerans]
MTKKWVVAIFSILTIALAACGDGNAEEVFTNAMEAAKEMESAELVMDMKQEIEAPGESPITMESKMDAEMITDPIAMYQKGTMSMTMDDFPMDLEMELYLVDGEAYTYDSMSAQWIKLDSSAMPGMSGGQPNLSEQLETLEQYVEDFEFEETEKEYVYKLTADGEGFTELTNQLFEEYMSEDLTAQFGEELSQVMENMDVTHLYIEMYIDKETYQINKEKVDMDMTLSVEGEELNISQSIDTEYKGINTVENIEVPQEVKDSAIDAPAFN